MLKRTVLVLAVLFFTTASMLFAQDWKNYSPAYKEGDIAIQAGVSLIPLGGFFGTTTIPPLSISADYAVRIAELPLSFGGFVGYSASKYEYYSYATLSYTYLLMGARAAYHVDLGVKNLDSYAGVMLGYNIVTAKWDDNAWSDYYNAGSSYVVYGAYVGARYFFTKNLAAFGEAGYGMGLITLGVTYKL